MNNIINIFFACAHITIYIYLLFLIYKKFVRPYLMSEQQQQRAFDVQLDQRQSQVQARMQTFTQQVIYLTQLFKKISEQQAQAQKINNAYQAAQYKAQLDIQKEYAQQQELLAYKRQLQNVYNDIAPEVKQELSHALEHYYQQQGKQYLQDTINELHKESQSRNRA